MQWIHFFDFFVFDFDGLLVDTETLHKEAYRQVLAYYDIDLLWDMEKYASYAHMPPYSLQDVLMREYPHLKKYSWDRLYQQKKEKYIELLTETQISLMPGVDLLIDSLYKHGKKTCVVTNSSQEQVAIVLQKQPILGKLQHYVLRHDYVMAKPDPESYLLAQKKYAKTGDRIVGFEDTLRGYQALKDAKIQAFVITPFLDLYSDKVEKTVLFSSFHAFFQHGIFDRE
ncbi:MAG: HAD family phosphatase [Parachlamydiales bacterium]|nr:HAD family phosphatase [Parachlamydiales bacterium]